MAKGMRVVVRTVLLSSATLPTMAARVIQVPSQGAEGAADDAGSVGEKSGVPVLPVAGRREPGERRKKIRGDRKRHDQRQRPRIGALRVLHFFGHGGELFVAGVKPQAQRQAHAEHIERRLMRQASTA